MGLAASQARLLVLTARKSDLEFRAQNITNRKLLLSTQTEQLAMNYTRALSNRQLRFVFDYNSNDLQDINESFSINSIYAQNSAFIGKFRVRLADGRIAVSSADQLPFALKRDNNGNYYAQTESTEALYGKLSEAEKVSYLSEAIGTLAKQYDEGKLSDEAKEAFKLDDKVTSEGNPVASRYDYYNALMTNIFGETSPVKADKTTPEAFTEAMAKNLTDEQKADIKSILEIMQEKDLISDDVKIEAVGTDAQYKAAVDAINGVLVSNGKKDWLAEDVDTKAGYKESATTATDTKTKMEYLKEIASNYNDAADKSASKDEYKAMAEYLRNNPKEAYNLILEGSSFGSYVASTATSGVTVTGVEGEGASQSVSLVDDKGNEYIILPALNNTEFFQNSIREGSLLIEKLSADYGKEAKWESYNWASSSIIQDRLNTEDDAMAEAEYETQTAILQSQDKMLDVELRQIETQQKACDNEYESVKKILDKNIERSFKVFS